MGQAKRRGTREERVAQSIERQAAEKEARIQRDKEMWAAMTPEQRAQHLARQEKARNALRLVSGVGGLLGPHSYYPR
jgi:Spy/CpxP family protein refolding chaperone